MQDNAVGGESRRRGKKEEASGLAASNRKADRFLAVGKRRVFYLKKVRMGEGLVRSPLACYREVQGESYFYFVG